MVYSVPGGEWPSGDSVLPPAAASRIGRAIGNGHADLIRERIDGVAGD
jgi:hypothetical protein